MTTPRQPSAADILAAVRLGDADRAALRAFALAVAPAAFETAFAQKLGERGGTHRGPDNAEAAFFHVLLDRVRWPDPAWLDALTDTWQNCEHSGSPPLLATAAASALLAATRETLDEGRTPDGRAEWDILTAVEKLAQAAATRLAPAPGHASLAVRNEERVFDPAGGPLARAHFDALIEQALAAEKMPTGLLLLHVDWGVSGRRLLPAERDALQRALDAAMQRVLRPGDVLCAIGDHEWALLMPGLHSSGQTVLAARRLADLCVQTSETSFAELRPRIHVGHARAPDDAASAATLKQAAHSALHRALCDDEPVVGFRADMLPALEYELELERDIARSVARPPFELWLQPQVSLATGRCDSAEALIRWRRGGDEWVPPPRIIEIASRLGLMPALSRWVLSQAVRMLSEIRAAGIDVRIALNLVASDLHDDELPELVAQSLAAWRMPADKLCLEVTEGALIGDLGRAAAIIERLRAQGCNIALDDFGTGFSSLGYLRDLPVTELKIDQLFVREMLTSGRDRAIVTSVQALARGFDIAVVAEGVEGAATADELRRIGCDYAQGYLYARAMPQREFTAWLYRHERGRRH